MRNIQTPKPVASVNAIVTQVSRFIHLALARRQPFAAKKTGGIDPFSVEKRLMPPGWLPNAAVSSRPDYSPVAAVC
jgi:hypothetical protein